jgi:hypothetical protein
MIPIPSGEPNYIKASKDGDVWNEHNYITLIILVKKRRKKKKKKNPL